MKIVHLSDLHLGKRVNEFSMLEDQAYILSSILRIIDQVQPQGVSRRFLRGGRERLFRRSEEKIVRSGRTMLGSSCKRRTNPV